MDFSQMKLEDAVPLMRGIEDALESELVERVQFRDDANDCALATLTRGQAERLLQELEDHFFAAAN